jgi:hypothetical protein
VKEQVKHEHGVREVVKVSDAIVPVDILALHSKVDEVFQGVTRK